MSAKAIEKAMGRIQWATACCPLTKSPTALGLEDGGQNYGPPTQGGPHVGRPPEGALHAPI